jgi:hypothetical protein
MPNLPEETLTGQYDRAVEEYRFQVDLNWRRSEYFFVLNVGILIASATMFSSGAPRVLIAALFLVGTLLAGLSFVANDVQHGYYQSARNRKRELEESLKLEDVALATTPGMGSGIQRLGKVGTFLKIMLVAIGVADLVGAGLAISEAAEPSASTMRSSIVVIHLGAPKGGFPGEAVVVISQKGRLVRSRRLRPQRQALTFALKPGDYLASVAGEGLACEKTVQVTEEPLQLLRLRC